MSKETTYSVILDTGFFIRLLSSSDPLHDNAVGYFKYFCENEIPMYISTISIAEYCVKGDILDLPIRNLKVIPFNIVHAPVAGRYASILFKARDNGEVEFEQRLIIPNDVKIFAQASVNNEIKYFVTADSKSKTKISRIGQDEAIRFEHMDIHTPYNQTFGILEIPNT